MHALWLALVLVTPEAPAAVAPVPVAAPAARETAPPVAPTLVSPEAAAPRSAPAALPQAAGTPAAPASPSAAASPAPALPQPLPQAAVERLGQGDRAFLAHDYRNALFAYQDAVYIAPKSHLARVKLGRAYLALRYASRAIEQAEAALALEPASADARRLLEEARNPVARPEVVAAPASPAPSVSVSRAPAPAPAPAAAPAATRVYRFTPEPETAAPASEPPARRAIEAAPEAAAVPPGARRDPAPAEGSRTVAVDAASIEPAPAPRRSAAQRYREALAQLQAGEFAKADATLSDAVAIDPGLAVAHAARASARFGLRRYREAATDYRAALELDPGLGTPLYGLAECYRALGDKRNAAEMYGRYARSDATDVREDLRALASKRARELR